MWLGPVDVPDEIVEAHRVGDLVLFVGAGASMAHPSDLVDFVTLAQRIADYTGYGTVSRDRPDLDLGTIEAERKVDVHTLIASEIGDPNSHPNEVHRQLARLSVASETCRVVTTNYDMHLSRALAAEGWEGTTYRAPALPIGDDFDGIVYLHGALDDRRPDRLVATDRDFGRAYLSDAWATRFLDRMFSGYVVLFVGYSHSDVVMSFLARGLRPGTRRFALTDNPQGYWRMLGVQPVVYPNDGAHRGHVAIPQMLTSWADLASMGVLDHARQLRQLTSAAPPLTPAEQSYLKATVADPARFSLLLEQSLDDEWFDWVCTQDLFQMLCRPGAVPDDPRATPLASWFARQVIDDPSRSSRGLRAVQAAGDHVGPLLWTHIGLALLRERQPTGARVSIWLRLLLRDMPARTSHHLLEYALDRAGTDGRWDDFLAVLDGLLAPRLTAQVMLEPTGRFAAHVPGSEYQLRAATTKHVPPNWDRLCAALLTMCDGHLRRAHDLSTADQLEPSRFDLQSFRRAAIEQHPQDSFVPEAFGILVDLARDAMAWALQNWPQTAAFWLAQWERSDTPLLRRLATHAWATRHDVAADDRVRWLVDAGLLPDGDVHHEVFALLAEHLPGCADNTVAGFVEAATAIDDTDEFAVRKAVELVRWADRQRPGHPALTEAATALSTRHPDVVSAEHPDFRSWMSTTAPTEPELASTEELHEAVGQNPAAALTLLHDRKAQVQSMLYEDPIVVSIAALVAAHPFDGFALHTIDGPVTAEVVEGTVRGWTAAAVDTETAKRIAAALAPLDLTPVADEVSRMLVSSNDAGSEQYSWVDTSAGMDIATQLGHQLRGRDTDTDEDTGDFDALNEPAGRLARFWVLSVSARWQSDRDAWTGMPRPHNNELAGLVDAPGRAGRLALFQACTELSFLHAADPHWTERTLLLRMRWADAAASNAAWNGYLAFSSISEALLRTEVFDGYVDVCTQLPGDDNSRDRLARHLAVVTVNASDHRGGEMRDWMRRVTTSATMPLRVAWLGAVVHQLRVLPAAAVARLWEDRLRPYWQDRVGTIPTELEPAENTELCGWIPHLGDAVPAAVDLAVRRPTHSTISRFLFHELDTDVVGRHPLDIARLTVHLVSHASADHFWEVDEVKRVHDQVVALGHADAGRAVREAVAALGVAAAADWEPSPADESDTGSTATADGTDQQATRDDGSAAGTELTG